MSFLVAWRLWFLLGVGALAGAWIASWYRRRKDVVRFTNVALLDVVAPQRPGWRRHLPAALWLVAMTLLVVGFARPVREVNVAEDRATVVLALDVSLSMEATDVEPSRLEVAKEAAVEFVDALPDGLNVGLVTFSGTVRTVPPASDRDDVKQAIEDVELSEYTAIGEAIFTGLDLIAEAPSAADGTPAPGRLVVLSDGETTTGRPDEDAAEAAADANVAVDTIAFGTDEGYIDTDDGSQDVPVMPGPLQDTADTTGGNFYEADSLEGLTDAYREIETVSGSEKQDREIGSWFIGTGLLLLGGGGGMSLRWSQRLP